VFVVPRAARPSTDHRDRQRIVTRGEQPPSSSAWTSLSINRRAFTQLLFSGLAGVAEDTIAALRNRTSLLSDHIVPQWVNVSGAEFSRGLDLGKRYVYASNEWLDRLIAGHPWRGIRFPFKAYRLFDQSRGQFRESDLQELRRVVEHVSVTRGLPICLDMHDYGRFQNDDGTDRGIIGESPAATLEEFAARWSKIAAKFRHNPRVSYCLMNEPHDQDTALWLRSAQAALTAIRKAGSRQLVMVPGGNWTGAHSWLRSNARHFEANPVDDPADNWCYDWHQYLDRSSSGTSPVAHPGSGDRVSEACAWAAGRGERFFIGEWAFSSSKEGAVEAMRFLSNLDAHRGKGCLGSAYWASGPWWKPDWNIVGPGMANGQLGILRAVRGAASR
jgi:endoglucanase